MGVLNLINKLPKILLTKVKPCVKLITAYDEGKDIASKTGGK